MKTVVVINTNTLGWGDAGLGAKLMSAFLRKLWSYAQKPETIVFYNSGVMLLAQGSPCLDTLEGLFQAGVDLVACGTCVSHYQLSERLALGRVSDMQEIVSLVMQAEKVMTV